MVAASDTSAVVKTKIIATVGPASESVERLTELMQVGVDVFRLNMAHGSYEWHGSVLHRIRQVSRQLDRPVAMLADLAGPKIRLGPIAGGSLRCEAGQTIRFVSTRHAVTSSNDLTSTYAALVDEVKVGDLILLADGTVSMRVDEKQPSVAICRVVQPGEIRSGGGINLPGVDLKVEALTGKDRADVQWLATQEVDFLGLSFVRSARDVQILRSELTRLGCTSQVVAKIEKPQAVEALEEVIRESDAIMVARGDLGVEIDVARVPAVQKKIISSCHAAGIPVITATQMLESMRFSRLPTRAEATDVANAILDGSDGLMLSAETAVGEYPVEAVSMMCRIARETEELLPPQFGHTREYSHETNESAVTRALVEGTGRIADQIRAKLVVVATRSGTTALVLSKQRSHTPIVGISDNDETVRRMCMYWGVTPLHASHFDSSRDLLNYVVEWARSRNLLRRRDRVVLIAGTRWTATGHNMIVIHEVV